ncbi:MAG: hypothetical protein ACTS80_00635 [Candidatus Hodgkinia cicadicola]
MAHRMPQTCLKSVICAIPTPFNKQSQPMPHAIKLSLRQFGFLKTNRRSLDNPMLSTIVER